MTVQTTVKRHDAYGNGTTVVFPVPFYFLDSAHLTVLSTAPGAEPVTLVLGSDYTVAGAGEASGGYITTTVAPVSGVKISILRNVPLTQLTHYVENDPFPAASHERALDLLTMEVQQVQEQVDRSLTLSPSTSGVSAQLPTPLALHIIAWNEDATALQSLDPQALATTVAFGTARADIFPGDGAETEFTLTNNPGAQANLDISVGGITQIPGVDYTWDGGTVVSFTTAPPLGVNILIRYFQGLPQGVADAASTTFQQAGTSVVRTAQAKMRETVSVTDFGAVADGVTDNGAVVNTAITHLNSVGGGVLRFPVGTYKINSAITQPDTVTVDLGRATLDFSGLASGYAWTITNSSLFDQRVVLQGGTLKGVASPGDGVYAASTHGILIAARHLLVEGTGVRGFQRGIEYGDNCYAVTLRGCTAWYNYCALYGDQSAHTNMGAALDLDECVFAHNDFVVYNKYCEITFRQCAWDSMQKGGLLDNINSSGGYYNSHMTLVDCRFENGGNASFPWFKNSGFLYLVRPQLFEPFTYTYLFDNSGYVSIDGGFTRDQTALANSRNTGSGSITVKGFKSVVPTGITARITAENSGVYNSNFELGTNAGWSLVTGSLSNFTIVSAAPHSGTYNASMVSAGAAQEYNTCVQLDPNARYVTWDLWFKNANAATVYMYFLFYNAAGVQIGGNANIGLDASISTWTRKAASVAIPAGASYAKIVIQLAAGNTLAVQIDDIYVNQF